MFEGPKKTLSDLVERAREMVGDIKSDIKVRREINKAMVTPVDLEDGNFSEHNIDGTVEIFQGLFPEAGITKENIKDVVRQVGLTQWEYEGILMSVAYGNGVDDIEQSTKDKMHTLVS